MLKVLLTGASGFVGSHILERILKTTDWRVTCPVTFRHRGNPDRITEILGQHQDWWERVDILTWDLRHPTSYTTQQRIGDIDIILNVASESHVDRSITSPGDFITNNVTLMTNVLELAYITKPRMVLHMSTDEVYGPADPGYSHREWDPIRPSNPYSASKAAQEAIAFSYWRTYNIPIVITNTMNIIGERQDIEKFVPKTIRAILRDEPIEVHVSPLGQPGSRHYLHADSLAHAWMWIIDNVKPQMYGTHDSPTRFNIVGEREVDNIDMVNRIASLLGVSPKIKPVDFHTSRPGHDLRYSLDGSKLRNTGWRAPLGFDESLERVVRWTTANPRWVSTI